jgi:hypothetical protein
MPNPAQQRNNAIQKAHQIEGACKIGELYCKGYTYRRIAEALGICTRTVERGMKLMREEWKRRLTETSDEIRAYELAKCDKIEQEAWEAWDRSKKNHIQRKHKVKNTPDGREVEDSTEKIKATGDPRYLQIIEKIIDKRLKILGIFEPQTEKQSAGSTLIEVVISSRTEAKKLLSYMDFEEAVEADSVTPVSESSDEQPGGGDAISNPSRS